MTMLLLGSGRHGEDSTFDPAAEGDLIVWLRDGDDSQFTDDAATTPCAVDDDPMRKWLNQSGNPSSRNNYRSPSFYPDFKVAVAAGKPGVLFNGDNNDFLSDGGQAGDLTGYFGSAGWTMYIVCNPTVIPVAADGSSRLMSHAGSFGDNFHIGFNDTNKAYIGINWGTNVSLTQVSGTGLQCLCFRHDTAKLYMSINRGTEISVDYTQDMSNLDGGFLLGNNFGLTGGYKGYMHEMLVWAEPLGTDPRNNVLNYLLPKWGLS